MMNVEKKKGEMCTSHCTNTQWLELHANHTPAPVCKSMCFCIGFGPHKPNIMQIKIMDVIVGKEKNDNESEKMGCI